MTHFADEEKDFFFFAGRKRHSKMQKNNNTVSFNEIKSLLVLFPDLISKEQYDVLFAESMDYKTADDLLVHDE